MHPLDRRSEPVEAPPVGRRTFLKAAGSAVAVGAVALAMALTYAVGALFGTVV